MKRLLLCLLLSGCSAVDRSSRAIAEPDPATFPTVHAALLHGCGTLDCHGAVHRNFRIYGATGLRLEAGDVTGEGASTEAEIEATRRALIGIEPFLIAAVIEGRAGVESLTLVRKARGREAHVAGAPYPIGSSGDRCLASWLVGGNDEGACVAASGP